MSITSLSFILFIFALLLLFFVLPKKWQWAVLLCASVVFYVFSGVTSIIYILLSSVIVFSAALFVQSKTDKQKACLKEHKGEWDKAQKVSYKKQIKKVKKAALVIAVILNFSLLIVFKYSHFLIAQTNTVLGLLHLPPINNTFSLIVPLGISYYTLQSTGYMTDVFWGKSKAEKNWFKVLLFVSFFPQITQGPISEYNTLSSELFKEHHFSYNNFSRGFQRMLWGFFKKMVIADVFSPYVTTILSEYKDYSAATLWIGAFLYMFQLYADFSGYMDIMCGYCEMLDIRLTENFRRPYFSKSISEFWRRWHISLGAWLRTYVYYPVAISGWNQKLSQKSKKFGASFAANLSASIPLIFVWLFIGLWHDASWAYILWGLGNAVFIISFVWLEPVYKKMKHALHIRENALWFKSFQIARTFGIFMLLEIAAAVAALSGNGFEYIGKMFTDWRVPAGLSQLLPQARQASSTSSLMLVFAVAGLALMFGISLLERKKDFRDYFNKIPLAGRILVLVGMTVVIVIFGVQATWGAGAFMYANF